MPHRASTRSYESYDDEEDDDGSGSDSDNDSSLLEFSKSPASSTHSHPHRKRSRHARMYSNERLAKFEREQEILFQQKKYHMERELSNVLERNAVKSVSEKKKGEGYLRLRVSFSFSLGLKQN